MPTVRYNARRRTCQPSIRRYSALLGGPCNEGCSQNWSATLLHATDVYTRTLHFRCSTSPTIYEIFRAPFFSTTLFVSRSSTIDFPEIFIPGRAQRWRNRCACSIGESYEYLIYDEKYNVTYCKEQNYKRIYFMDLYIYMFRIFLLSGIRKML